jgi:ATP-binding protein involved in chromosome partitioning
MGGAAPDMRRAIEGAQDKMAVLIPDRQAALKALDAIRDPRSGKGIAEAGLVKGLVMRHGRAGFALVVPPADLGLYEEVRAQAEAALAAFPGIQHAQVMLAADDEPPPAPGTVRVRRGARLSAELQADAAPRRPPPSARPLDNVRHVVAVASGKGGVGKSTVAVNLAVALSQRGLRVGLLDADVYGPSAPRMTGLSAEPEIGPDKKLMPLEAWGLKVMSIGLIVDEGAPMIWRGPMASSAFNQMSREVAWAGAEAPLDVLIVDMPPGTGDIQLSLVQKITLSGAVVVSTPQEVALIDARRAISMFRKTETPVIGLIENMAYFTDAAGAPIEIFGRGGVRKEAETSGAPFLGEIPIDIALREASDNGTPIVAVAPDSAAARAFVAIAEKVAAALAA